MGNGQVSDSIPSSRSNSLALNVGEEELRNLATTLRNCADSRPADASTFAENAQRVLRGIEGAAHVDLRLECLLELCRYYYLAGQASSAVDTAWSGVSLARAAADLRWQRRMLTAYGNLQGDSGNLPIACEALGEALDICDRLCEPIQHAVVWTNCTWMFTYAELPEVAIRAGQTALSYLEQCDDSELRTHLAIACLANASFAALTTRQYSLGLRSAKRVFELSENRAIAGATDALFLTLAARNFARLSLRVRQVENAKRYAGMARELSLHPFSCSRAVHAAALATGLVEAYTGSLSTGVQRILACLTAARIDEPNVVTDFLRALVEANEAGGNSTEADRYRIELIEHVQRVKVERTLAHYHSNLARLVSAVDKHASPSAPTGTISADDDHRFAPPGPRLSTARSQVVADLVFAAALLEEPSGQRPFRVARLASLLALRCGHSQGFADALSTASICYDIGKVALPSELLCKPAKLSGSEQAIMQSHTSIGADLVRTADIEPREMAIAVARHHHESWDGSGYPDGLSGVGIPLAARLVSIAEAFDAMTHERSYRPRMPAYRALEVVIERAGHQFDPTLVAPFCSLVTELRKQHLDLDEYLGREQERSSAFMRAQRRIYRRMEFAESAGQDLM